MLRNLNIADWLSIYRIISAPFIVLIIILSGDRELTGWLLLVGFITDAMDGFIARRFEIRSKRGASLDSTGDALIFSAGVFGLFWFEFSFIKENLVVISVALGLYLLQLLIAIIKYGRTTSFHTYSAKTSAVIQAAFLVVFHLYGVVPWLFCLGIIISILETLEEIILIFMFKDLKTDVKGIYWVLKGRQKDK